MKESISMSEQIQNGKLYIDKESYLVFRDEKPFTFPRKEFELLILLASKPGKVFTRSEISKSIWKREMKSGARSIDVYIRHIREKLGEEIIYTVVGVGYKLVI
jgi:two-component system, OmpR family, alkaline phosphatase synthesis response regulator PhoP